MTRRPHPDALANWLAIADHVAALQVESVHDGAPVLAAAMAHAYDLVTTQFADLDALTVAMREWFAADPAVMEERVRQHERAAAKRLSEAVARSDGRMRQSAAERVKRRGSPNATHRSNKRHPNGRWDLDRD